LCQKKEVNSEFYIKVCGDTHITFHPLPQSIGSVLYSSDLSHSQSAAHYRATALSLAPPISVSHSKTRPASHAHWLGQPTNGRADHAEESRIKGRVSSHQISRRPAKKLVTSHKKKEESLVVHQAEQQD
jgi:hypothetical protein